MSKLQNSKNLNLFIDYVPAELKEYASGWKIEYYAIDPFELDPNKRLKRKQNRVRPISNKTERRKFAKRICCDINKKLPTGWTPFVNEKNTKAITKLFDVFDVFLNQTEQKVRKGNLSKDTLRAYTSFITNLKVILVELNKQEVWVNNWDESLTRDILEVVYYDRDNSAVTHNNYLTFIGLFTRWMIKKRYIGTDFTKIIDKIKTKDKVREIIPNKVLETIFNNLKTNNFNYFILCYTAYYCLIRRTELTKLKVSDIYIKNNVINIRAEVSKTNRDQMITIPEKLAPYIVDHIKKANNEDFVFSCNNFLPGKIQLEPKKVSDTWGVLRKTLVLPNKYQWYSLKDTGITNYLHLGLPTIDVKNQARHHSISQTEKYIPKNIIKAVSNIQSAKLNL